MPKKPSAKKPAKSAPKTAKLEKQVDELTEDLKRIQADFANFKRRSEQDSQRAVAVGKEFTVTSLLPVIDNLQRAMKQMPADLVDNTYLKGISSVAKQLEVTLESIGVKKLQTLGQEFDSETMDAVAFNDGDGEKEIVEEELQAGYELDGRVIRHAMVKVKKQ